MKSLTTIAAIALAIASWTVQATTPAQASLLTGEVLEVKDVDAYTYLRLKTKDGETWAAVTKAPIKKGAQVAIANPMVIQNFESKSLKKKFEQIVFGNVVDPNAKPVAMQQTPHIGARAADKPIAKIAKASGPNAKTVEEVISEMARLKDKPVVLRAQVVKVTSGILGKNWIHLQDGSGSAASGTNDVLITCKEIAAVGDVVTAKGTVRTDVNLGSGYNYTILIEDAELRK
jgi:hypothetical protein